MDHNFTIRLLFDHRITPAACSVTIIGDVLSQVTDWIDVTPFSHHFIWLIMASSFLPELNDVPSQNPPIMLITISTPVTIWVRRPSLL